MATTIAASADVEDGIRRRLAGHPSDEFESHLDAHGWAVCPGLLTAAQCRDVAALYPDERVFRSRIVMARHGFGRGEYPGTSPTRCPASSRRCANPLIRTWRRWRIAGPSRSDSPNRFRRRCGEFLARCHAAGQTRPTPLLLQYGPGDFNALHQDVYGPYLFPLQLAVLLSRPGEDFTGGEFVLTEQRPRMQSRAHVVPLQQGDGVVFAVHHRPARGTRGTYRVTMRHGVSEVRTGRRHTLGVIFHDAT